jgi:hypothetical protein
LLKFFEVTKDDRLFAAYVVAATTGLRRVLKVKMVSEA